jgi:hypothetical protein
MSSNRASHANNIRPTGPYDDNFKQMLIDGGVYPLHYKYMHPDGPQKPNNLDEVVQRLSQPQPAISSTVSDHEFREYTEAISYDSNDDAVKASVIPMFLRAIGSSDIAQKNVRFNNLTSPADSLKEEDLEKAKSDFYYGCQPEQANANVRKTLSRHIVPSSLTNLPIAPNFFIEVIEQRGFFEVERQAWYNGVIGARAMHSLHSYNREPVYDNKIYTLTAIYDSRGSLSVYGHSMAQPNGPETRPESYTFTVGSWRMITDKDSYVQGLTVLKNAEEWTKGVRDAAIEGANEMEFQTVENEEEEGTNDEEQECIEETW